MNAKTTAEHLQIRVDDITRNLQAREEKLAVYEGRSTSSEIDSSLTREQQLEAEVAELRLAFSFLFLYMKVASVKL